MLVDFKRALDEVLIDLAQLLARDGEGATKFVDHQCRRRLVERRGAQDRPRRSPTRRWSRPRSPARTPTGAASSWRSASRASAADRDKLRISIGGVAITDGGQVVPNYDETPVAKHIKGTDIVIDIDLGIGRGRATVWTCDLTHGYIDINGSYRS